MRPIILLLLLFLPAGCLARGDETLVATPLPLSGQNPEMTDVGKIQVLGLWRLTAPQSWFGGISGIAWDADEIVAVSDTGSWLRFAVHVDALGRPQAVGDLRGGRLGGVGSDKAEGDAEDITADGNGNWLVAFERRHRVWRYGADLAQGWENVALATQTQALGANEGIESMTRLGDGRLLLIAEGQDDAATSPAWIGRPGQWQSLDFPHHGRFRPTAAAALPDGGVLVLERRYTLPGGPAMRLRRIAAADLRGGRLEGEELVVLEPPLAVDNFEALAVRPRADGRLVATILSDDNFNPLQSTLMLTVLLP
ncbi:esterase-like activity of phytase family protein [Magnetospirillum sulfuroxidans]|uniref:Esterase-like activity of phytase family protein n=1 Tax=Magnetospirillum sulfuroxidans TaxID=611300 RepID=A0ABS5I880_9PROT|nr:esterase-like activity of phytase family protein [Magnetospirillum sulfuroxidans]MBR9970646.1 esterase-like activity of phytase family protein [Magnetospirillum sulfuroxidans]